MEIKTLETAIIALKHIMCEVPDKDEIEGLSGNVVENFEQISNALWDLREALENAKNAIEVQKMLGQVMNNKKISL
jgi:hypothetical protein